MKNSNFISAIACLLFLLIFSSCIPHQSVLYIGGLRNTEFQDGLFLIDGVFFSDLNGGAILKEIVVKPGTHTFSFIAKNGRKKLLKIKVPTGENSLEYDSNKQLWLWNFKQYPDSSDGLVIIEETRGVTH